MFVETIHPSVFVYVRKTANGLASAIYAGSVDEQLADTDYSAPAWANIALANALTRGNPHLESVEKVCCVYARHQNVIASSLYFHDNVNQIIDRVVGAGPFQQLVSKMMRDMSSKPLLGGSTDLAVMSQRLSVVVDHTRWLYCN